MECVSYSDIDDLDRSTSTNTNILVLFYVTGDENGKL